MKCFSLVRVFLLGTFLINHNSAFSQNFVTDTAGESSAYYNAIKLYHGFLSPETGLYDGSEYTYNIYYPLVINEGDPFFLSKNFDSGTVYYNNILYEKVPLLFDIIKQEVLVNDPTRLYIIKLHEGKVGWFTIWGHTFIRLARDSAASHAIPTGFYDVLYNGNIALYKRFSKSLNENISPGQGIDTYVIESDQYFIKKNNQYYPVNNKKSLMPVVSNKKNNIQQFIRKNKLNLRKDMDNALKKIVAYYDGINDPKAINQ